MRAFEDPGGDACQRVLRPRLDVAQGAALQEHRENLPTEAAVEVVRLSELAELLGDLHQHVFARERPDLLLELAELVGPNVREHPDAAAAAGVEPVGQYFEEAPAMVEPGHRILVHGLLDELLGLTSGGGRAGYAQLHGRVAVDGRSLEIELDRQLVAAAGRRGDLERSAGPLAAAARDERALQRGLARVVEQVHERYAEQRIAVFVTE